MKPEPLPQDCHTAEADDLDDRIRAEPEEPDVATLVDRFDNDTALLIELGELFLRQNPQLFARITEAIRARDSNRLEHAAHSLKGSLLNLCAPRTAQYAGSLETMGAKGQLGGAEDACTVLAAKMEPFLEKLRRIVVEAGGNPETGPKPC